MQAVRTSDLRTQITPFLVAWLIAVVICMVVMRTAAYNLSLYSDFRSFYGAGLQLRTDPAGLYDLDKERAVQDAIAPGFVLPLYHPAYEALLFVPFSFLQYRDAYLAYALFNLLLLLVAFLVARDVF